MLIIVMHMMSPGSICPSDEAAGGLQRALRITVAAWSEFLSEPLTSCHTFALLRSQGHPVIPCLPTLLGVKLVVSSPPPHLLCPPRFFQSLSSASIFNQLSSTEGMEGLFSAFFTHYLNASSRSLVMRTLLAHNKIPGTTWAFTASAEWADLDVKFWMALRKRIYYVGNNPITHRVLPRITMYLCDQNFRQGTDCRVMVSASQASPSSAAPQANLQQTRSVRTLLHTVPINTDKLQDTSSLYIWVSGARKWCM